MALWGVWSSIVHSAFDLHKAPVRTDANPALLTASFNQLFENSKLGDFIEGLGNRVVGRAQRYMNTVVKLPTTMPGKELLLDEFRKRNIALIKDIGLDQASRLDKLIGNASGFAVRHEELAKQVKEVLDIGQNRAEFIARDQTLKLNGQAQQIAQTSAGIEEYEWSTSNDERVRESHQELNGQRFRWDDPPTPEGSDGPVNPGEDYNCRCVAIPIISLLEGI